MRVSKLLIEPRRYVVAVAIHGATEMLVVWQATC